MLPTDIDAVVFASKVVPRILEKMSSPDTHFVFPSTPTIVTKFLRARRYRKCTVYGPVVIKTDYDCVVTSTRLEAILALEDVKDTIVL